MPSLSNLSEGTPVVWNFDRGAYLYLKVSFIDDRFIYLLNRYDTWKDGTKLDLGVTHKYSLQSHTLREFTSDSWELLPPGRLESLEHHPYEEGF